jgi:glucan 1,3-beta-glucosidase
MNFGGWLNTEAFIVPGLYEKYASSTPRPIDEWTLSLAMGDNLATEMEEHYKTFITEKDFMEVAAAGFNYVRIPIGYWAVEIEEGEPFLAKVSWTYFLKAIEWARKYGLRINLDLRASSASLYLSLLSRDLS